MPGLFWYWGSPISEIQPNLPKMLELVSASTWVYAPAASVPSCMELTDVSRIHYLPRPKVGIQQRLHHHKDVTGDLLPVSTQNVQPASGAADPVLHHNHNHRQSVPGHPSPPGFDQPPNWLQQPVWTAGKLTALHSGLYISRARKHPTSPLLFCRHYRALYI